MQQTDDITFEARIDYETLREVIDPVDAIVLEARLHITEDGWKIRAVDPANVAMVGVDLPSEAFETYETSEARFGIYLERFVRLLDAIDEDVDEVTLSYNERHEKLTLATEFYEYTYATIDPDKIRQDPNIPEMDLNATIDIESGRLARAVEYFDTFATHATVGYDVDANEFYITAEEKDGTDDGEFRLPRDELGIRTSPGVARSRYSLDYFSDIAEALPDGRDVTLDVGEEFPFSLTYEIAPVDGPGDRYHGEVEHMQAPRIAAD